jgi:CDP-glucose 4,6-dehydratase
VRPFQHVLDPVRGMMMLAERIAARPGALESGWNFGPSEDDTRAAGWMAERTAQLWGPSAHWQAEPTAGPHEAKLLVLSSAQAQTRLGWRPTWDAEAALARAVSWYRAFYDGAAMAPVTQAQINEHEATASAESSHDRNAQVEAQPAA